MQAIEMPHIPINFGYPITRGDNIMNSIWSEQTVIPRRNSLQGDKKTEVAVIGAGMAGILTAYFLSRRGKQVIVLEADRIASGQTQNTTAKVTIQHGPIYSDLIKSVGYDTAKLYAQANEQALAFYRKLVDARKISCHFIDSPSYLYSTKSKDILMRELSAAKRLGIPAEFITETELPFPVTGAVRFQNQANFYPLEFMAALASELTIYERTKVQSVKGHEIHTEHGIVTAKHIVFACHYPFINIPGFYFARMYQERSYVLALSNTKTYEGMYYGVDKHGLSLRQAGSTLLLGGQNHRCGKHPNPSSYEGLRHAAAKYWPNATEKAHWSAQDCMTPDQIPYIGTFSAATPNWYVATGFQKWGMTTSMVAARLISDKILGQHNPFEPVFTPQRINLTASAKEELTHVLESAKGLSMGVMPGSVRCPHMGCQLSWNPDEASWDCPCHGSRFNNNGNLINGPAQEDVSFID